MIARNSNGGFLAAHWDWLLLGAGLFAAVAALVLLIVGGGADPDEAAREEVASLASAKKSSAGIEAIDMSAYEQVLKLAEKATTVSAVPADDRSFLASGRRIFCSACHKPIPGDAKVCPLCSGVQAEAPKAAPDDSDGDGIPDAWELKFGLDPRDAADAVADSDGDGFTSAEEFAAATDPTKADSHPDYLDFVSIRLPVEQTVLPFHFRKAIKTPNGIRFEFFDPRKKNDYGQFGTVYSVLKGEPIGKTGFVATDYQEKSVKQKIAGSNVMKAVDVSVATVERKSDGKALHLEIGRKAIPVDIKVTIYFNRGEGKEFTVIPGDEIAFYNEKYRVSEIKAVGKGAKVTLECTALGKTKIIEALEQ